MGLVGAPLGGILTDRIGRRTTLLIGLAGTVVGFIAYGILDSLLGVALLSPLFGITSDLVALSYSRAKAQLLLGPESLEGVTRLSYPDSGGSADIEGAAV